MVIFLSHADPSWSACIPTGKLPIDAFPDVTKHPGQVVSHADGLSAIEIERNVTYPIEMSMRGLPASSRCVR